LFSLDLFPVHQTNARKKQNKTKQNKKKLKKKKKKIKKLKKNKKKNIGTPSTQKI